MAASLSPLQPLGMGQLIDRAVRLYRQNFLTFIGIVAVTQIPNAILSIIFSFFVSDPTASLTRIESVLDPTSGAGIVGIVLGSLGVVLVTLIFTQIATAAMTRAVADNYLGHEIGIVDAYRRIGRSWLSLIWALIIGIGLSILLMLWMMIPCIGWFTGAGMLGFFGLVIVPLIAPIIVLEQKYGLNSFSRAWDLARRRFWWLLGFTLLLAIFAQIIVTGPTFLVSFLSIGAAGAGISQTTALIIQQAVTLIASVIYLPLQLTCITLLYFDVRVRTEGFDLAVLAAGGVETKEVVELTAQAPEASGSLLPNSTELGYFAIMTIAVIALYFALFAVFFVIAGGLTALGGF